MTCPIIFNTPDEFKRIVEGLAASPFFDRNNTRRSTRHTLISGDSEAVLDFDALTVTVPPGANVSIDFQGCEVRDLFLRTQQGWSSLVIKDGYFYRGGISIASQHRSRPASIIDGCVFDECVNAIDFGEGCVGFTISNCQFIRCVTGIRFGSKSSDNNLVTNCSFVRGFGTDVTIRTSGVTVQNSYFENRSSEEGTKFPYIELTGFDTGFTGGMSRILNNRFGPEIGSGFGPPENAIVLGTSTAWAMSWIVIDGNYFLGTQGKGAVNAVNMRAPVNRSRISNNCFLPHQDWLVKTSHTSFSNMRDNLFYGNVIDNNKTKLIIDEPKYWKII